MNDISKKNSLIINLLALMRIMLILHKIILFNYPLKFLIIVSFQKILFLFNFI